MCRAMSKRNTMLATAFAMAMVLMAPPSSTHAMDLSSGLKGMLYLRIPLGGDPARTNRDPSYGLGVDLWGERRPFDTRAHVDLRFDDQGVRSVNIDSLRAYQRYPTLVSPRRSSHSLSVDDPRVRAWRPR